MLIQFTPFLSLRDMKKGGCEQTGGKATIGRLMMIHINPVYSVAWVMLCSRFFILLGVCIKLIRFYVSNSFTMSILVHRS